MMPFDDEMPWTLDSCQPAHEDTQRIHGTEVSARSLVRRITRIPHYLNAITLLIHHPQPQLS